MGSSVDGKPPLLGSDPYGLLSRKPGSAGPSKREPVDPSKLDPAALMAKGSAPGATLPSAGERDPRAIARSELSADSLPTEGNLPQRVLDVSTDDVAARVMRGSGRPHVLIFYGAYCGVCRSTLPGFVDASRAYHTRNVGFTLASVDADRKRFEGYVPTLRRFFEPLWIKPTVPGSTVRALKRLGVSMDGDSFGVPFVAVFDRKGKVVLKGNGEVMGEVAKLLDTLI